MPSTGHFVLHSSVIPKLTAGHYELLTEQSGLPFAVSAEHTHITVAAPRYTMPTEQILSTFPPANADGAFGDRLPQIVLKRRTLPWERNPAELPAPSPIPWLALVVVAEGEAELSTATPVADCVTQGTKLFEGTQDKDVENGLYLAVTQTVLHKIFPCVEDLALLAHVREVDINDTELANGDDDGWIAVVLANRVPVFDVANNKPVRYMACLVNIEGQLNVLPPLEVDPPDTFTFELAQDWSVLASLGPSPDPRVMGRIDVSDITLPGFGSMNAAPDATGAIFGAMSPAAQLRTRQATWPAALGVALDGAAAMNEAPIAAQWASATERVSAIALDPDAKRLVRDTMAGGFRLPIEAIAIEPTYRFPVLAHWSFTTSTGDTFESLMKGLDVSLLGAIAEVPKPTPTEPQVAPKAGRGPEVVETGHIGLNLRSRRGDATRAWYRGPFVPFPTTRESPIHGVLAMAHSADQVRPTVPDGREDLSLAAAFEIGRLLALSQLSVVSALLRFRNEQFGVGRIRELLNAVTAFELPAISDQRIDLGRFIAMHTIEEMAFEPARIIGPRRPIADPGRELLVRGDLDALIAGGLGLDLSAVREMSDNVGIVAALAQARVPIAHDKSGLPFDDTNIAALHGALSTELNRVLNVAVPQVRRSESVVRATAQDVNASAPDPDVLDELIEFAASRPNRFPEEN